ncbi:MAG: hypothetical protein HY000_17200 [Planctomycetes bacterium]|nr:hypothetical protein [Planctomycetota bacterium]
MSEMSSLSHEYASTSDFAREINDAVLVLKRRFVRGAAHSAPQEVEKATSRVREILSQLLERLGEAEPGGRRKH